MKDVSIRNYQGIEKADITLADGVTVFVGPSDTGKSSVFRAITDWAYNAIGDGHVMAGAKTAKVEIDEVGWEKGKTINRYSLNGDVYDKVGRGIVPDEIQAVTGIREVEFGDGITRRLNIAEQFGTEFMIGEKASDNAKIIGSLSGIHVVFNALREATSDHQKAKREVETTGARIEEAQVKVDSFDYLEDALALIAAVKVLLDDALAKEKRKDGLSKLRVDYAACIEGRRKLEAAVAELKRVTGIQFEKHDKISMRLAALKTLNCNHAMRSLQINEYMQKRKESKIQAEISFDKHDELKLSLFAIRAYRTRQVKAKALVEVSSEGVDKQRKIVGHAIAEYDKDISSAGICPLTGEPLSDDCKSKMRRMK